MIIRNYRQEDLPALGGLYEAVKASGDVQFWWVGDESNWGNVWCAFEGEQMVGKGQVGVFNVMPPGRSPEGRHKLFLNLKTYPGREGDTELLDALYERLHGRAMELAAELPAEYRSILCVGNYAGEQQNNGYFTDRRGYLPLYKLQTLERDLTQALPEAEATLELEPVYWNLETESDRRAYLELESEVWPESALGMERLEEYRGHALFTAIVVREAGEVAGSVMVWREDDSGIIEDIFVREPWRRRGIARRLLVQAMRYLKEHGLVKAQLDMQSDNGPADALYRSLGFQAAGQEELRFYTRLN
ncbi:GNAT family N-acetyltransferase [Paenibacillus tengchongensis]|uniref:GNAT family N-acetyltransferase n=1 Tax=Paenibacillus tengchongensis TaxID=2608684 RepID=UPI001FE32575|nr:GNAT family N-acetyltransferase [Paenibacillus tengchongensis]